LLPRPATSIKSACSVREPERLAGLLLGPPPMQHANPDEMVARGAAV
jgi:hypothetical protein